MPELKAHIQTALTGFVSGNMLNNAKSLLNVLGYESDRALQLSPNNYKGFAEQFAVQKSNFSQDYAKTQNEAKTYWISSRRRI